MKRRRILKRWTANAVAVLFLFNTVITPNVVSAQRQPAQNSNASYEQAREDLALYYRRLARVRAAIDETGFKPAARAREIGPKIADLFAFVRDGIAYEPYRGVQRMGQGTLMSRAGNACDQSLLLIDMLRFHKYVARLASATLSEDQGRKLLAGTNKPPAVQWRDPIIAPASKGERVALKVLGLSETEIQAQAKGAKEYGDGFLEAMSRGYDFDYGILSKELSRAGLTPTGADDSRDLLTAARDHCWVQVLSGAKWVDLDPAGQSHKPGERLAEATAVTEKFPFHLAPKLHFAIHIDQLKGGKTITHKVLDKGSTLYRPVNRINVNIVPEPGAGGSIANWEKPGAVDKFKIFMPEVGAHGGRAFGAPFDLQGNLVARDPGARARKAIGGGFGGAARVLGGLFGPRPAAKPKPAENGRLIAVRVTLTMTLPGGGKRQFVRELARRPTGQGIDDKKAEASLRRQLVGSFDILATSSRITTAFATARRLDQILAMRAVIFSVLADRYSKPLPNRHAVMDTQPETFPFEIMEFFRVRRALMDFNLVKHASGLVAFAAEPQMVGYRRGFWLAANGETRGGLWYDIFNNRLRVAAGPATNVENRAAADFSLQQGVIDTLAEYLLLGGGDAINAHSVLARAIKTRTPLALIRPRDTNALRALPIDSLTRKAMADDLKRGDAILAPTRMVTLGGKPAFAWWRVNPATGETLGRGRLGGQTMLEKVLIEQKKMAPLSLLLCTIFTALSPYIGGIYQSAAGFFGGWEGESSGAPHRERSLAMVGVEFIGCMLLTHGIGAAITAGAYGVAGVAASGGIMAALRGGGARPPPRPSVRPPPIETPGARPGSSGRFGGANEPPVRPGVQQPRDMVNSGSGTIIDQPGAAGGGRTGPTGTSVMRRPGGGQGGGSGRLNTPGERPGAGGQGGGRPGTRPGSPQEQFRSMIERETSLPPADSLNLTVERAIFENALSPSQRQAAMDAYARLRQADPLGNPRDQLSRIIREARTPQSGPDLTVPELVARGALENPRFLRVEALADAAGVSPQQMRQILDAQTPGVRPNQELYIDADGYMQVRPRNPRTENMSLHERQMMDLNRSGDRRSAAADTRVRAAREAAEGMSPSESLAGQAHHQEVPPGEFLNRTGQTRAQGQQNLSNYLQRRGLNQAQAEAAAAEYFNQGGGGSSAGGGPPTEILPEFRPPGDRPTGGGGQPQPGGARLPHETQVVVVPNTGEPRPGGRPARDPAGGRPSRDPNFAGPEEATGIFDMRGERIGSTDNPPPGWTRNPGSGNTEIIPAGEMERIAGGGNQPRPREGPPTERIPASEMERIARGEEVPPEPRLTVEELTPENLGVPRRETPAEAITRLQRVRDRTPSQEVELRQARIDERAPRLAAERRQQQAELQQRQQSAGEFDLSQVEGGTTQRQLNPEQGRVPRRPVVAGDGRYVRNIMESTPYRRTQGKVYAETINGYVRQILRGDPFPLGRNGRPIKIGTDGTIIDGHHRLIAAQIVSRLTGRPLTQGPNRVIPGNRIVEGATPLKPPKTWDSLGVRP